MKLQPYVFFYGRCEEALDFYKTTFGGNYEASRNSDAPAEMTSQLPAEFKNKIMHASFTAPGVAFFASDGREAKTINPDDGNVSLCLEAADASEGDRIAKALADGGTTVMPLDAAFWGGRFGIIHDRFGIEWFITSP